MSVEQKIRELLAGKQLSEENAGPMGAAKGKDTSIPAKTAGDAKNPRQGSSEDATIASERDQETDNPGAKEASPVSDNKSKISQSGAGAAPNFTTYGDPTSVVNQASSRGNVHQEEYDPEEDEDLEDEDLEEEVEELDEISQSLASRAVVKRGDKVYGDAIERGDVADPKQEKKFTSGLNRVKKKFGDAAANKVERKVDKAIGLDRHYKEEFELEEEADFAADLATLFDGNQDLSEEFRGKAASLFEAMVVARVTNEITEIEESLIAESATLIEEYKDELVEKVDSYLGYVAEQWVAANEVAVENTLRSDITESFISGLKNLFAEHYVDVPEEKYDVLGEMQDQLEELASRLDETLAANVELHASNVELQKESVLTVVAEDLAKTDAEKLRSLVADVEFENADIFEEKLTVIKENYFPKNKSLSEERLDDGYENEFIETSTSVNQYVKALDAMVAKN